MDMEALLSGIPTPFTGGALVGDAVTRWEEPPQSQQSHVAAAETVTDSQSTAVASAFSPLVSSSAPAHAAAMVPAAPVPVRWLLPVVGVPLAGPNLPADRVLTEVTQWLCAASGWQLWRAGASRMDEGGKSVQTFRESFAAVQREAIALGLTLSNAPTVSWMTHRPAVSRVIDSAAERRVMWRGTERRVGESRLYQLCDAISKTLDFLARREPSLATAAFVETQNFLRTALRSLNLARKKHQREELQRKSIVGHAQNITVQEARRVARFVQTQLDELTAAYRPPERQTDLSEAEVEEETTRLFAVHHRN